MQNIIKVIHADDHAIVRNGFRSVFETNAPHIQVVGEASSYEELYSLLQEISADILLLDGLIGDELASSHLPIIRNLYPNLKILLLWLFADTCSLTKWIHMLDGQLPMGHINGKEIISAITEIMRGEKCFVLPVPKPNISRLIEGLPR